jgi:predicted restriction endonuclease
MFCKNCNDLLIPAATRKNVGAKQYCDNKCQNEFQAKVRVEKFISGEYVGQILHFRSDGWLRKLLTDTFGYKCACCGINTWLGKQLILEVNHKDGDASNNVLSNLEYLCHNCHSQTDTFKAKNKTSARTSRNKKFKS